MQKNNFLIGIIIVLSIVSGGLLGYLISSNFNEEIGNNQKPETNQKPESDKCDTRDTEKIYQILKQNWGKFYTGSEPSTMVILDFYGNLIADGTVYTRYTDVTKNDDGSYTWGVYNPNVNYTAQPLTFYPVDVKIYQEGKLVETNTKVDRFIFDSHIYAKSILDQYDYTGMPE